MGHTASHMTGGAGDEGVVQDAIRASNLRDIASRARERLLRDATRRGVEPGAIVHVEGESRRHVHLVLAGVIRMFVSAVDGRSITVRYCRPGSLIGIASLFAPGWTLPVSIEALTPVELLDLHPDTVVDLSEREPSVTRALLTETSERVQAFVEEIPRASFATVPQRVARHLLDLAATERDGSLVARISQEELAAAVGTVREVAARALRGLRDAELVRTERNRIVLVDVPGLITASHDLR